MFFIFSVEIRVDYSKGDLKSFSTRAGDFSQMTISG